MSARAIGFGLRPWLPRAAALVALVGTVAAASGVSGGSLVSAVSEIGAIHPNSFSISELHVRGERVELQLRCQVLSLAEVLEDFDRDLDGRAEAGEVEANAAAIAGYVASHYRIVPDATDSAEAADVGRALLLGEFDVAESPLALDPMNEVSEWVDVRLSFFRRPGTESVPPERLGVHVDLFQATSPGHRDSAAVVWNGLELGAWQFAQGSEAHVFVPTEEMLLRNEAAWRRFARRGVARVMGAWDLVLLVGLVVLGARRSPRSVLLAGGLALAAIAGGALVAPSLELSPQHVRFLQLTVPLALGYIALDDLLHRDGRTRLLEPAVFGAVAGAREVTALAPSLATEEGSFEPTLGFALGLVAVLGASWLVALGLAASLSGSGRETPSETSEELDEAAALAPRTLRVGVDVVALALAAWGFQGVFLG